MAASGAPMHFTRFLLVCLALPAPLRSQAPAPERAAGFETITEQDVGIHLRNLAARVHEGRDSPSAGLARAARYIAERFQDAGLELS